MSEELAEYGAAERADRAEGPEHRKMNMTKEQAEGEMREEARYNARMRGALLAANDALRREVAQLNGTIGKLLREKEQNRCNTAAWGMTAAGADACLGIYIPVFEETRNLLLRDKIVEAYDYARVAYAQARHEEALAVARRKRVAEQAAAVADPAPAKEQQGVGT